jgi:hypothetical protein
MIGHRAFLVAFGGIALGAVVSPDAPRAEQGVFMRDALSRIGLIEPERPSITYRERAPLVMPPKLDAKALPPPRSPEASPQWPKDPEIAQRERAAVEARKPIVRGAQGRMNDNNMTLSIDEMRAGRRAGAEIPDGPVIRPGDTRESNWLNPFEMLRGATAPDKTEPTIEEPQRDALTQPPTGYRKAPRKVAKTNGEPVYNPSREREEADPGAYIRNPSRY